MSVGGSPQRVLVRHLATPLSLPLARHQLRQASQHPCKCGTGLPVAGLPKDNNIIFGPTRALYTYFKVSHLVSLSSK